MRNILLTSTAAVCLMLTAQVAQAQSDQQGKKHEQKVEHSQKAPAAEQPKHADKQMDRRSTTGQATEEKSKEKTSKSESMPSPCCRRA